MKRKLTRAQGMVEYALMLTMVAVPMIVIYATLGDAVGQVWQSIIDSLDDSAMFTVADYTLNATATATEVTTGESPTEIPTNTHTVDPYGPPTEVPTATEIPPTATHFVPATMTFTATAVPPTDIPPTEVPPTEIPPTEIPTETDTPEPTPKPFVTNVGSYWSSETKNNNKTILKIIVQISIDSSYADGNSIDLNVKNINTNKSVTLPCTWYCVTEFTLPDKTGGYISITSDYGDYYHEYAAMSW